MSRRRQTATELEVEPHRSSSLALYQPIGARSRFVAGAGRGTVGGSSGCTQERLDAAIDASEDPSATCRAIVESRRADLPQDVASLLLYLDDVAARVNRRAEHYESVAKRPAPPLQGRLAGDRVMTRVATLAKG